MKFQKGQKRLEKAGRKPGENKQTQAQIEFEAKAKHSSYAYHVCRSIDEFMKVVNEYLE